MQGVYFSTGTHSKTGITNMNIFLRKMYFERTILFVTSVGKIKGDVRVIIVDENKKKV